MKRNILLALLTLGMIACGASTALAAEVPPLVSTKWVAEKLDTLKTPGQTKIRLVEVGAKYGEGHIPGAVQVKFPSEVFDPETDHMVVGLPEIERVLKSLGVTPGTHIVLYDGDGQPHQVSRFYWTLKYWNVERVSLMDGGKTLWEKENRPLTKDVPNVKRMNFEVKYPPNTKIRAMYSPHIVNALATGDPVILDCRAEKFFKGEVFSVDKWVRTGHLPGALNVFSMASVNGDREFKSKEELQKMYSEKGITPDKKIIAYCDTGVLASHAWFVLNDLLGYKNVSVYDGSMREYANRFDTPMEPGTVYEKFPKTPIQKLEGKQ
ncbi:MAG: sulfurtransferase [Desulfobacteraceae bacterium]|nr:MAG: sulfurtransferase [Desulfobacteraceae bacterium]